MFKWLKTIFETKAEKYNREFEQNFGNHPMSVDHDLISEKNRNLIERENLKTYQGLFNDLQNYSFIGTDEVEVAGVRHYQSPSHGILVSQGDQVLLFHDADNPYDKHAVKVKNLANQMLGYIPQDFSEECSTDLESMMYFEAFVDQVSLVEPAYPSIYLSVKKYKPSSTSPL